MKRVLIGAAVWLFAANPANALLIDFEEFNDGDLISLVGNATFSSGNNVEVYAFGGSFAQSGVNTIAPDAGGGSFTGDLFVDFTAAVDNLSFWSGGDDIIGLQATINVFVDGLFASAVGLVGDGSASTTDFHDLSAFSGVTRIEIVNVIDPAGLVYDDFGFDVTAVPEPSILGLFALGLIAVGVTTRRRKLS